MKYCITNILQHQNIQKPIDHLSVAENRRSSYFSGKNDLNDTTVTVNNAFSVALYENNANCLCCQ